MLSRRPFLKVALTAIAAPFAEWKSSNYLAKLNGSTDTLEMRAASRVDEWLYWHFGDSRPNAWWLNVRDDFPKSLARYLKEEVSPHYEISWMPRDATNPDVAMGFMTFYRVDGTTFSVDIYDESRMIDGIHVS